MAKQNLSAQITIGGSVARSLTRSITNTRGHLQDVGQEIAQATNRQRKLSREIAKAEQAGESVAGLRNEYNKLDDQLAKLNKRRNVLSSMTNVGDRFGKMRQEISTLGRRGGIAIGGLATSMGLVTHATANSNERVNQFSKRLEVSTKWLSRNQYAARQFGIESDTLADGIKELSLRSDEFAKEGGGEAAEAFKRLGLNQREVNELSKDTEELYEVVQGRISSVQSVAARQRISDELFGGQAGEQMIELLQVSREEMRKFYNESDAAGATITEQQVAMARNYSQEWQRMRSVFGGVRNILGNKLMPVMTDLMGQFSGWIINNRDRVDQFANTLATQFKAAVPAIMNVVSGIGSVAGALYTATHWAASLAGGFDNLGIIIGAVFSAKAVMSVVGFAGAIGGLAGNLGMAAGILPQAATGLKALALGFKSLGLAMTANPIGAAITGIAIAAGLVYTYWEPISGFFSWMWDSITANFQSAFKTIKTLFSWSPLGLLGQGFGAAWNYLSSIDWSGVGGAIIDSLASGIKSMAMAPLNAVKGVWSGIEGAFDEGISGVGRLMVNWSPLGLFYKAFSGVLGWLGVDMPETLMAAGSKMIGGLVSGMKAVAMAPVNAVKGIAGAMTGVVSAGIETFKTLFSWSPLGLIMRGFGAAWNYLSSIDWSGVGGAIIDSLASGIKSMAMAPVNAVKNALGSVREYLPFSDAKKGPLSDLTKSGEAVPKTLARGIERGGGEVTSSMNKALSPKGVRGARPVGGASRPGAAPSIDVPPAAGERQQASRAAAGGQTVSITNEINLQVSRAEGEPENDYISRLADRLMEELNDRQEGALFDG